MEYATEYLIKKNILYVKYDKKIWYVCKYQAINHLRLLLMQTFELFVPDHYKVYLNKNHVIMCHTYHDSKKIYGRQYISDITTLLPEEAEYIRKVAAFNLLFGFSHCQKVYILRHGSNIFVDFPLASKIQMSTWQPPNIITFNKYFNENTRLLADYIMDLLQLEPSFTLDYKNKVIDRVKEVIFELDYKSFVKNKKWFPEYITQRLLSLLSIYIH